MAVRISGASMTHNELLQVDNRELLLEYRMVNNSIKEYGTGTMTNKELDMLLDYRHKLHEVIIEKMSYYEKLNSNKEV